MSIENLNQFLQAVSQDSSLQQQLLQPAIEGESLANKVVELGQEKGYQFTLTEVSDWMELMAAQTANYSGELSEEELEAVAGAGPIGGAIGAAAGALGGFFAALFTGKFDEMGEKVVEGAVAGGVTGFLTTPV